MKYIYSFTFLLVLIHTSILSKEWEMIDNNSTIPNPDGNYFHFKSFEMEELYGIFYTVNLNNTNGILTSTNLARRWEVSFYESYNSSSGTNIIYNLIKKGNQLYAPADPGSVNILNSKTQKWSKVRVSPEFNEPPRYLQFVNDSVGFIGYHFSYGFFKTTNRGLNWNPLAKLGSYINPGFSILNFAAKNENELYMVGKVLDSLYFYKTTNSGNSWTSFQSELFEKSDLVSQGYYNLTYEKPYFYVENRYKQLKVGITSIMRSTDFVKWEPVFISDSVDFGKFIHGIKFYGIYGFAMGTQAFLYTDDGGDTWFDLYDKNDKFYENNNPINGFFFYQGYIYASGAIDEQVETGNLIRVNKFFRYDISNITSVESEIHKVSIYPNPTQSIINIESDSIINSYEIIDLSGKVHASNQSQINDNKVSINIENLISGTYFIRINERLYKRFVKE